MGVGSFKVAGGVVVPGRVMVFGGIIGDEFRPWFLSCFCRMINAAAWPVMELEDRTADGVIIPFLEIVEDLRLRGAFAVFFGGFTEAAMGADVELVCAMWTEEVVGSGLVEIATATAGKAA